MVVLKFESLIENKVIQLDFNKVDNLILFNMNVLYYFKVEDGAAFEIKLSLSDKESDKLIPVVVRSGVRQYVEWVKEQSSRQVRKLVSINSIDISTGERILIKPYTNFRVDLNPKLNK